MKIWVRENSTVNNVTQLTGRALRKILKCIQGKIGIRSRPYRWRPSRATTTPTTTTHTDTHHTLPTDEVPNSPHPSAWFSGSDVAQIEFIEEKTTPHIRAETIYSSSERYIEKYFPVEARNLYTRSGKYVWVCYR